MLYTCLNITRKGKVCIEKTVENVNMEYAIYPCILINDKNIYGM